MAQSKTKHRSPMYPSISLPSAIEKLSSFYKKEGKNEVPKEAAVKSMGYKSLNGRSLTVISTLCQYGLLEQNKGTIRISDDGWAILEAPKDSSERKNAIMRCSNYPTVFLKLKDKYKKGLPSDDAMGWELKIMGFSSESAKVLISVFRDTISFEKSENVIYNDRVDNGGEAHESNSDKKIEIGDLVNWESQEILQFREPKRVAGFSDCNEWVFVEGSKTGMPIQEIKLIERKVKNMEIPATTNTAIPPKNPFFQPAKHKSEPINFPVPSGLVTVMFPDDQPKQTDVTSLIKYLKLYCANMGWDIEKDEKKKNNH